MSVVMPHRFLGDSGLLVSRLSIGSYAAFNGSDPVGKAYEILRHAFERGINTWDTSESYHNGEAERILGQVVQRGIDEGVWTRADLVIVTKLFFGSGKQGPNTCGLSRKHLVEGIKASLQRMNLEYVDVVLCHRSDKHTPVEETVRALDYIVNKGWALYWGTSNWISSEILEAFEVADRLRLIRPIAEQPEYNILQRSAVELDYVTLYKKYKWGLMTWSPLAFSVLTGKYKDGIPDGSRMADPVNQQIVRDLSDRVAKTEKLRPIAEELECSLAQLAIAWCLTSDSVSTVILGASSVKQLDENLEALSVAAKITEDVKARIDTVIQPKLRVLEQDFFAGMRAKYL